MIITGFFGKTAFVSVDETHVKVCFIPYDDCSELEGLKFRVEINDDDVEEFKMEQLKNLKLGGKNGEH